MPNPFEKSLVWLSLFVVSTLGSGGMTVLAEEPTEVPAATVEAREIAFAQTMADRDLEAFLGFVSAEAVFLDGPTPLRGREAIGKAWGRFFQGEAAPFSWKPDQVVVLDSGDLAFSSGPVVAASGQALGRFNSIWRKESDGKWRVVFDKGSP